MKLKVIIIPLLFIVAFSLIVSVISQAKHNKMQTQTPQTHSITKKAKSQTKKKHNNLT